MELWKTSDHLIIYKNFGNMITYSYKLRNLKDNL